MQWVTRIFEIYVKASFHVAFAVSSFLFISGQFLNIPVTGTLYFFVFFSTVPTYNLIKNTAKDSRGYLSVFSMARSSLYLSIVSAGIALYFGIFLHSQTWLGILCLALLTAVYALPVLPRGRNLRHLGILKILIIAAVWAGTTVFLPVLEAGYSFYWDAWLEFAQRLLVILVLMVPFEIRDLSTDPGDMMTIPQRLGIGKTRKIGLLLCVLCFFLNFLEDELSGFELLAEGGIVLSLITLLLFLPRKQGRYFASFWVEAFPVFWAAGIWAGREMAYCLF
jgi:hypothetical protein